jgi:predicted DNA-binding transcriptional regulator YafY
MARIRTLVRTLKLWRFLEGRSSRPELDELADMFGVSSRTIRRDLAALTEVHLPVPPSRREVIND